MNKQIITFTANEQSLVRTSGECHYSSNKVSYIEAHFDLGQNWSFESVRAVWFTDFNRGVSTVLDTEGICVVPTEVLTRKGKVHVNLVGSDISGEVITDRLTSYPIVACIVDANARINGSLPAEATPSQVEQFANAVKADADRAEAAKELAEGFAEDAEGSANRASISEANAKDSEENALASAQNALASEENARASEQAAAESAQSAEEEANRAEQASANAGYMFFHRDERGHLIYERTSNTQVDFYLSNGHLFVEAVA